jgi:hypothetical protein
VIEQERPSLGGELVRWNYEELDRGPRGEFTNGAFHLAHHVINQSTRGQVSGRRVGQQTIKGPER